MSFVPFRVRPRLIVGGTSLLLLQALVLWLWSPHAHAQDTSQQRADALVTQMTTDEKLDLVASGTNGVPRLGIPPLAYRDGPNGVGEGEEGVTAFPNAVTIGAAWDPKLARRYGGALGEEVRAKGFTGLLGPTIEPLRNPLWGRAAETYGEDPFLNAQMAAQEVRGIQSAKVLAQIKHFAVNTQEYGRFGIPLTRPGTNSEVALRTLQEIYFAPFRAAIQQGQAASVMCSYVRINGTPSCQNPQTLGILKGWGLLGFVAPDAVFAIRDVLAAANAGLDNFQLGAFPPGNERSTLASALASGDLSQSRLDDAARRIVLAMAQVGLLDAPAPSEQAVASTSAHRKLATTVAAEASVLLKNKRAGKGGRVLPIGPSDRSIAVIGYDAGAGTQLEEGGSPAVLPSRSPITPLDGIRDRAPSRTKVSYAKGTRGVVPLRVVPSDVLTPASGSGSGLSGKFYASAAPCCAGSAITTRIDPTIDFATPSTGAPSLLQPIPGTSASSARWTGTLTPPESGRYRFSLTFAGNAKLFIDGEQVISGDTEFVQSGDGGYPGAPDVSYHGVVDLRAGQPIPITVEYATSDSLGGAELHLGWQPPEPKLRAKAVKAASKSDAAVVFVNDVTSEGMDRTSLSLPGDQDDLIRAVAKANPHTVVVLHTASAALMPWRNKVAAIVEAWYPGQQSGKAIAKTLFGDVDPSGRLPVTFPKNDAQSPTANDPARYPGIDNNVEFSEGLGVGYRYYDANGKKPLYPFGFGLSYTSFELSGLKVKPDGSGGQKVSVRVENTGDRAGAEVVQAYVGFPSGAGEPPRQLKAFAKVSLKSGQKKTVKMRLDPSSFEIFDEASNSWVRPSGKFRIYVGTSSRDLPFKANLK